MNDITDNDKLMAAICYPISFIVSIVILLSESMKVRPFQKFHAVQALVFDVVLWVIVFILAPFTCGLSFLLWLVSLWPAYKAYQGEYVQLPVITDFIRKQGWVS
jgi:uncharacterized membrane protein